MQLQDFCGQMEKQLVAFKESLGQITLQPGWIQEERKSIRKSFRLSET